MITISVGAVIGFGFLIFVLGAAVGASVDAGVSRWLEAEEEPAPDIPPPPGLLLELQPEDAPLAAGPQEIIDAKDWQHIVDFKRLFHGTLTEYQRIRSEVMANQAEAMTTRPTRPKETR